jgi:hypothetical protein
LNHTQELSRVTARIKTLTEKTVANGCTEAEVLSAAEMVGRPLERYALSMDEIEVRSARCVQVGADSWYRKSSCTIPVSWVRSICPCPLSTPADYSKEDATRCTHACLLQGNCYLEVNFAPHVVSLPL